MICSGPKLNITSFNSLQVDYCEQPPLPSSRQVPRIKLLQRAEIRTIFYSSCLISVDYLITRCSAFDDSQVVEGGFFSEILILGTARCAELHQKQVYLFPTGEMVAGLKINQTITATHTLIGTLDREGQGASYSSDRGTWKNVVVQSNYKIYLGKGIANSQTKDNILIMPTGTRLKLSELYGLDTFKGEVIWSNDQILQSCDRTDFDVLYDGPASIIIADKQNPSRHETHTYMVRLGKLYYYLYFIRIIDLYERLHFWYELLLFIKFQWSVEEKIDILKNMWVPDPNYKFPKSGNRNLRFQINWTYEFCWLCYSKIQDGAFCLTCILFQPSDRLGKGGHQIPGKFVTEKYIIGNKPKICLKPRSHGDTKCH